MTLLWQRRGHGHLQPLAISFSQEIFGLWIVGLWDIYFATSPFLPSYLSYWVNLALDVVWIHSWLSDFLLVSLCSSSLNSLMTVAPRRHWDKADRKIILNLVVFPCFFLNLHIFWCDNCECIFIWIITRAEDHSMCELSEGNYFFLTHCEVWQHLWCSCCLWYSQINMFDLCTVALHNRKTLLMICCVFLKMLGTNMGTNTTSMPNEEFHFVSWGLMHATKIYLLLLLLLYFPIISNCKTQPINWSQCKTTSDD